MKEIVLMFVIASAAHAQIFGSSNARRIYGLPIDSATCSSISIEDGWGYFWDAAAGLIKCKSPSASANTIAVQADGTAVATEATLDIVSGAGITPTVTDAGSKVTIQFAVDSAVVETRALRQAGTTTYLADAGDDDTYAVTVTPTLTAYAAGQCFVLVATTANTGAATINIDSLGAKNIVTQANAAPADGAIAAGRPIQMCYDGTSFVLPPSGGGSSPTVTTGMIDLGPSGGAANGTNGDRWCSDAGDCSSGVTSSTRAAGSVLSFGNTSAWTTQKFAIPPDWDCTAGMTVKLYLDGNWSGDVVMSVAVGFLSTAYDTTGDPGVDTVSYGTTANSSATPTTQHTFKPVTISSITGGAGCSAGASIGSIKLWPSSASSGVNVTGVRLFYTKVF